MDEPSNNLDIGAPMDDIVSFFCEQLSYSKCVLFLGPELLINNTEGQSYRLYFKELTGKYSDYIDRYFERDNVFAFKQTANNSANIINDNRIRKEITTFYDTRGDELLMNLIAELPFPLIVNVAPDNAINKNFQQNNFKYQKGYFPKPLIQAQDLDSDNPLIYNIFGSIEERQSIILTHQQLFSTIKSLMQENSIPEPVRNAVKKAGSFIFLGMKFETWYYQLLLSIFNIEVLQSLKLGTRGESDEETVSIMTNYFRIDFSKTNSLDFIARIHAKLKERSPELLRTSQLQTVDSAYLSYAWNDNSGPQRAYWADRTDEKLRNKGMQITRDRNVLTIRDNILSYMNRIGRGRMVVMIISEKYLYSEYCMYEAWTVFKNDNFSARVSIIILPEVDLANKEKYVKYWQDKTNEQRKKIEADFQNDYLGFDKFMEQCKTDFYIFLFINQFLNILSGNIWTRMLSSGTEDATDKNECAFESFVAELLAQIKKI